jgi:hypothetical protein
MIISRINARKREAEESRKIRKADTTTKKLELDFRNQKQRTELEKHMTIISSRAYGGADDDWNLGRASLTQDGGLISAGTSKSGKRRGNNDIWVLKLDASGNKEWENFIGTKGDEQGSMAIQLRMGSYVVKSAGYRAYVLLLNSKGVIQVQEEMIGAKLVSTLDGGALIAGQTLRNENPETKGDIKVIKWNSNGEKEWERKFGGNQSDGVENLLTAPDGGALVVGKSFSKGVKKGIIWLLKLDRTGKLEWDKTIGSNGYDLVFDSVVNSEGSILLSTMLDAEGVNEKYYLIKIASTSEELWRTELPSLHGDQDIIGQPDGSVVLFANVNSRALGFLKTGQQTFDKTINGIVEDQIRTTSGDYIMVGWKKKGSLGKSDMLIAKYNELLELQWEHLLGGKDYDSAVRILKASGNSYIIMGKTTSFGNGGSDLWLLKVREK